MKVDKIRVSFDPVLGEGIRAAARRAGGSLSGWLADAATAKLRSDRSPAVDASVVAMAATGDRIMTSDADGIRPLVAASGRQIAIVPC